MDVIVFLPLQLDFVRVLLVVSRVYHLRKSISHYHSLHVIGLSKSGKSSLMTDTFKLRACHNPSQAGLAVRTSQIHRYSIKKGEHALDVFDTPGFDYAECQQSDAWKTIRSLASMHVLVWNCKTEVNRMMCQNIYELSRYGRPLLVVVTHGDQNPTDSNEDLHARFMLRVDEYRKAEKFVEPFVLPPDNFKVCWNKNAWRRELDGDKCADVIALVEDPHKGGVRNLCGHDRDDLADPERGVAAFLYQRLTKFYPTATAGWKHMEAI
jgi:GTP-binding protein EngB required for normal cell division